MEPWSDWRFIDICLREIICRSIIPKKIMVIVGLIILLLMMMRGKGILLALVGDMKGHEFYKSRQISQKDAL